jgi:pimeloyl-ACP methyl ester carboxylesterase
VLLHGFPDDLHLYDRLVPELAGRRVVSFDFLGWGASEPGTRPLTWLRELDVSSVAWIVVRYCGS